VKQNIKFLEHNKSELKIKQLTLSMNMETEIPKDDPVRLARVQLEELDYGELYRAIILHEGNRQQSLKRRIKPNIMRYSSMVQG
jgi:transposase